MDAARGLATGFESDVLWVCSQRTPPPEETAFFYDDGGDGQWDWQRTYAQFGEDLLMRDLAFHLRLGVPSYLDPGAWEPINKNNTYLFYRMGGRGVLVEPNPALAEKLRRVRPEDTVLQVGVGTSAEGSAEYFLIDDDGIHNTFSAEQAAVHRRAGSRVRTVRTPLVPLNDIIQEHFADKGRRLDVLSIDIEGLDLAILETLDFERYRPRIICVETLKIHSRHQAGELITFIESKGYELRGATYANSIFVDKVLIARFD